MYKDFVDWCQQISFCNDENKLQMRWDAIEGLCANLEDNPSNMYALVRMFFGNFGANEEYLETFKKEFRDKDATFRYTDNDLEISVLSGCILAYVCLHYEWPEVPATILTASACQCRSSQVQINLISIALNSIVESGTKLRERKPAPKLISVVSGPKIKSIIQVVSESADPIEQTNKSLLECMKLIQGKLNTSIKDLHNQMMLQDEELQILWWLTGHYSRMWDKSFKDIGKVSMPILLAKEMASLTSTFAEPPSMKSILCELGINDEEELSFIEVVNACELSQLEKMKPKSNVCPVIFPLHNAIFSSHEMEGDGWEKAWSRKTDISIDHKVSSYEISTQYYREFKLINSIGV